MDQKQTPIPEALAKIERRPIRGFGAPGHNLGRGAARDVRKLLGSRVFEADIITPKGSTTEPKAPTLSNSLKKSRQRPGTQTSAGSSPAVRRLAFTWP